MTPPPASLRFPLLLGGTVLIASLAVLPNAVPVVFKAVVPVLAAIGVWVVGRRGDETARRALEARAADAESALAGHGKAGSQLRHDIRGYLSPALLNADRLSTNPDPIVRRAADTMIVSIERIEARLRDA